MTKTKDVVLSITDPELSYVEHFVHVQLDKAVFLQSILDRGREGIPSVLTVGDSYKIHASSTEEWITAKLFKIYIHSTDTIATYKFYFIKELDGPYDLYRRYTEEDDYITILNYEDLESRLTYIHD